MISDIFIIKKKEKNTQVKGALSGHGAKGAKSDFTLQTVARRSEIKSACLLQIGPSRMLPSTYGYGTG